MLTVLSLQGVWMVILFANLKRWKGRFMSNENLQRNDEIPEKDQETIERQLDYSNCSNLFKSLLSAQACMKPVEKDARNDYAKYDYVSAEKIVTDSRDSLHKNGLLFTRQNVNWDDRTVFMTFVLFHPESGERIIDKMTWPITVGKQKPMDKAVAAALTSSLSYWLRDILAIPRVEKGDEVDNPDTECPIYDGSPQSKVRLKTIFEQMKLPEAEWKYMSDFCLNKQFVGLKDKILQRWQEDFGAQ
jgi:hypothetical protein